MISCTRVSKKGRRGNVEAAQVGHCQPHDNGGDEPGVLADHVASGGHGNDCGQLGGGAEHLAEPEPSQQEPQQGGPGDAARQAYADARQKLSQLVAESLTGARHHGVENDGAEDAADRIDQ